MLFHRKKVLREKTINFFLVPDSALAFGQPWGADQTSDQTADRWIFPHKEIYKTSEAIRAQAVFALSDLLILIKNKVSQTCILDQTCKKRNNKHKYFRRRKNWHKICKKI